MTDTIPPPPPKSNAPKLTALQCGFCLKQLRQPVSLPCSHSICSTCARTGIALAYLKALKQKPASAGLSLTSVSYVCPQCSTEHTVKLTPTFECPFPPDDFTADILTTQKKGFRIFNNFCKFQGSSAAPKCVNVDDCGHDAVGDCSDCHEKYCESCFLDAHKWKSKQVYNFFVCKEFNCYKSHKLLPLGSVAPVFLRIRI